MAVIKAPDFIGASMTNTARLKPAMMRFRRGKWVRLGVVLAGYSLITIQEVKICLYKSRFLWG